MPIVLYREPDRCHNNSPDLCTDEETKFLAVRIQDRELCYKCQYANGNISRELFEVFDTGRALSDTDAEMETLSINQDIVYEQSLLRKIFASEQRTIRRRKDVEYWVRESGASEDIEGLDPRIKARKKALLKEINYYEYFANGLR